MAKQTLFGVNKNMLTRQGTSPYETRLYAGTNPLTKRIRMARLYGSDTGTNPFKAGSDEVAYHNAGYTIWASTNTPGTYSQAAAGNNDAFYTQLFRDMHALDWGGTVSGTVTGASFGGTKAEYIMWTPEHEADGSQNAAKGTASEYKAMWAHLRTLLTAVENSSTYNPGGTKRVYMTTCPTGTGTHFGTGGWQPPKAQVDICGYDKYFPSVGPNLFASQPPPYVDGTGGQVSQDMHLEALRAECDANYGADMPLAIGEIGVSVEGTHGTDPNRLNLNSLRYRWFTDADHGVIDYLRNTRFTTAPTQSRWAVGDPRWICVNYFVIGFPTNPTPPTEIAQGFQGGIAWQGFKATVNSLVDTVTGIAAPTPGTTTGVTSTAVTLNWTNPSGSTGTRIYEGSTQVTTAASGATTKQITGLAPSSAHTYTLKAVAADGTLSAASSNIVVTTLANTDTVAPTIPGSVRLSGTATTNSFAIAWNASTDQAPAGVTPSGVSGYRVYLNGTKYGADLTATTLTKSFTNLTSNTSYGVRVSAFDVAGNESSQSTTLTVTTANLVDTEPPSVPGNVQPITGLTALGAYGATWTASSDNVEVAGYQVRVDGVEKPVGGLGLTWQGTGSVGQVHTFEVRAVDTSSLRSNYSTPITLTGAGTSSYPTPVLDVLPSTTGEVPFQITADLSGSTDPDGQLLTYTYKWGDGSTDLANISASLMQHTYVEAGTYQAEFGVRDTSGLYSPVLRTISVVPVGTGTAHYRIPYVVRGASITADQMNTIFDLIDGAVFSASGSNGNLTSRWDAEAILRSGSVPTTATNVLPPGIEVPYETTISVLSYTVGTAGIGTGSTVIACRYIDPNGASGEIPGSRVTIPSGQTKGSVGGLEFQARAGSNLVFDLLGGSATPASDLRVHVFGV